MAKINSVWIVTTLPQYEGSTEIPTPFTVINTSALKEAEEIFYRYQRLRDEDRPILILIHNDNVWHASDQIVFILRANGLPAELAPGLNYPTSPVRLEGQDYLFRR